MSIHVATSVIQALEEHCITIFARSSNSHDGEINAISEALDERVDGVIAMPAHSSQRASSYSALATSGIPVVFIDHYIPNIQADYVVTDNFGASKDATAHLISLGHRRIAHFTNFATISSGNG